MYHASSSRDYTKSKMKNNARQTPALTEQEQQYVQAHEDEYNNRTNQNGVEWPCLYRSRTMEWP
jgi:cytochrome c553